MPGQYSPPAGELLLAHSLGWEPVGVIGMRPLDAAGACEMKRLYVRPEARGCGLGEQLILALIARAQELRYREMRLDTLPTMLGAQALYRRLGFGDCEPYYSTPVMGTVFMCMLLPSARSL